MIMLKESCGKIINIFKKSLYFVLVVTLAILKLMVYGEALLLNHFTETRGDGVLFRLWLFGNRVQHGKRFYSYFPFYLYGFGNLNIGDYCSFGEFTKIWNFATITIGHEFMAAEGLTILTGGHDPDTLEPIAKGVEIGDRVWCGANVTIMPGVRIGNDVVVGAGSIVIHDVPDGMICVGVPAKVIREIDKDKRNTSFFSRRTLYGD